MNDHEARTPNDDEREALNGEAIAEAEKELPPLIVNGIDTMAVGRIAYVAGYIAGALRRSKEPEWEYGEQSRLDPERVWTVDPESQSMIWADIPESKRVRRRAAGPWVPVKQEGAEK